MELTESFLKRISVQLGSAVNAFQLSLDQSSVISLRLNPSKKFEHQYTEKIPWCSDGFYLTKRPVFTLDPLLHAGAFYVQEASSMLLEQALRQHVDLSKPLCVLDLCASPGGKSTHLLSLISDKSVLVSNEVIKNRTASLKENLIKWGYSNSIVTNNDAQHFSRLPQLFDLIVVDAPCSGEGLFRKDKNAMLEWSEPHTKHCSVRQQRIFEDVLPALKPGGILVYSTCTFNPSENEKNIDTWIEKFNLESLSLELLNEWKVTEIKSAHATSYQCWPHLVKGEGFYMSVLKKSTQSAIDLNPSVKKPILDVVQLKSLPSLKNKNCRWLQKENELYIMSPETQYMFSILQSPLHVLQAGTHAGQLIRNELVPSHSLALSNELKKGFYNEVELNHTDAIKFLRKQSFEINESTKGWLLVTHQNLALGWVKNLGNRFNNYYPANWRILMS